MQFERATMTLILNINLKLIHVHADVDMEYRAKLEFRILLFILLRVFFLFTPNRLTSLTLAAAQMHAANNWCAHNYNYAKRSFVLWVLFQILIKITESLRARAFARSQ